MISCLKNLVYFDRGNVKNDVHWMKNVIVIGVRSRVVVSRVVQLATAEGVDVHPRVLENEERKVSNKILIANH